MILLFERGETTRYKEAGTAKLSCNARILFQFTDACLIQVIKWKRNEKTTEYTNATTHLMPLPVYQICSSKIIRANLSSLISFRRSWGIPRLPQMGILTKLRLSRVGLIVDMTDHLWLIWSSHIVSSFQTIPFDLLFRSGFSTSYSSHSWFLFIFCSMWILICFQLSFLFVYFHLLCTSV